MSWISVEDRLPDDGIYCIAATIRDGEIWDWDKARYSSTAKRWMRGNSYSGKFNHWMPFEPAKSHQGESK